MPHTALEQALVRLSQEGGDGNRLVAQAGRAWFVFHGGKGQSEIRSEAAARHYIGASSGLDLSRVGVLRKAGFTQVAPFRTLQRVDSSLSTREIAERTLQLFQQVFAESSTPELSLHLDDAEQTQNEPLLQAMRTLAQKRDPDSRNGLYRALLRAELLLLVNGEGRPLPVDTLQGWSVFAVFTELDSLRIYEPRVPRYSKLWGRGLFPALMDAKVGSLLINPGTRVGGEIYRNEVETLAQAVQTGRRRS